MSASPLRHGRGLTVLIVLCLMLPITAPAGVAGMDTGLARCAAESRNVERLACFDAHVSSGQATLSQDPPTRSARSHPFIRQLASFERTRPRGDSRFRMSVLDGTGGRRDVLISAPALHQPAPRTLLTISCIDNISRLQLVVYPPLRHNHARISISANGGTVAEERTWQVLGDGVLLDAGRGLAAIEVIRRLQVAGQLELGSDVPEINGLSFDATGLAAMILAQREACRW